MLRPRPWEHGDGRVEALTPDAEDLDRVLHAESLRAEVRARTMPWEEFARRCVARFSAHDLRPGQLVATTPSGDRLVRDGDTLCCACGVGKPCHRVVMAPLLLAAGWDVHLDGVKWTGPQPTLFGS